MRTLTIKIPDKLDAELKHLASLRKETKSVLVREGIESILKFEIENGASPPSCHALASKFKGCFEGPTDLSTNKRHFDGFGK